MRMILVLLIIYIFIESCGAQDEVDGCFVETGRGSLGADHSFNCYKSDLI